MRNSIYKIKSNDFFNFIHNFSDSQYPFPFPIESSDSVEKKLIKELEYLSKTELKWWHINSYRLGLYTEVLEYYPLVFPYLKVIENNGSYMSERECEEISKKYDCMVVNNYGCREVWTIAFSCKYGHMHVNDENIYLEILDDNKNIIKDPDIVGNVVVTSLSQYAMPFIRYLTGDQASYVSGECECGKCTKRIKLVPGRNLIMGTNIYGNIHFRSVIRNLLNSNIHDFQSINIEQKSKYLFHVYVKTKNISKCKKIEHKFIDISNELLNSAKYEYSFSYNVNTQPKSIFTVTKPKKVHVYKG